MTRFVRLFTWLCAVVMCAGICFAQTANQGSIEGTVTDASGAVVPDATIKVTNTGTGISLTDTSDSSGYFRFPVLPVGAYSVSATKTGFADYKMDNVNVSVGGKVNLNVPLAITGQQTTVDVTSEAPVVETTRTQVSSTVNSLSISELPTNGRNFMDFVLLTPGVTRDVRGGDISFAGQRGTLNSLTIDGADNNNTFFGQTLGRTGSGRAPYQFSEDAVQEFQVNTNGYSAELGRAGGAVTNVVTKSGTNQLHGTAFEFFRDRGLNANDPIYSLNRAFAVAAGRTPPVKPGYHFNQFGGNLGGPIVKDKLFFFFDYDGQRNTFGESLSFVPTSLNTAAFDTNQRTAYNYLVARANAYGATFNQNVYLAKVDFNASSRNQFSLRYNAQRFLGNNLENSGSVTSGSTSSSFEHTGASNVNTDTAALQWTATPSNNVVNVARISYQRDNEPGFSNTNNPEAIVQEGGITLLSVGRNSFSPRETTIHRQQYTDTVSWVKGRNTFKFGVDFLRDHILNFFPGNFSGSYTFTSLEDFGASLNGQAIPATSKSFLLEAFAGPGTSGPTTTPNMLQSAMFFQDDWRVNTHLTLNLGLRYDLQSYAQPPLTNPNTPTNINTGVIHEDKNNLAPRFGFAYSPGTSNRTAIRGGWGIFYGNTPSILIGTAHSNNGINVQTLTFGPALMPSYPNNMCGTPAAAPRCAAPAGGASSLPTIYFFSNTYQQPMVTQYNLQVEHQIGNSMSVTVGYLGVRGTHLTRTRDINLSSPTPASISLANSPSTVFNYLQYPSVRPIAGFSRMFQFEDTAHSGYNGLIATISKRFNNGIQFGASYTWSHAIDDAPDATAVVPGTDDAKLVYSPLDPRSDFASSLNDVRHRLVANLTVDSSPFAKHFGSAGVWVLGGWELSGILTAQSGQPYSAFLNTDLNNDGNRSNERVPGTARNTYRLPSIFTVDPRITRNIRFGGERFDLKFIAEAFNVFNRQNITGVRSTLYNVSTANLLATNPCPGLAAGQRCLVPQTSGSTAFQLPSNDLGPRILQLAVKFVF